MKIRKIIILLILCIILAGLVPAKTFAKKQEKETLVPGKEGSDRQVVDEIEDNILPNPSGFGDNPTHASDPNLASVMSGMKGVESVTKTNGKIAKVLNAIIRLIQVAGTGISLIMVTMLGVKYMLASAGEKADIKKSAMPIVVGCVLLFAASNLVGIIASIGTNAF